MVRRREAPSHRRNVQQLSMRVVEITSGDALDSTIASAGSSLVIVDFSTTWCGPCKIIAPKFDELSDKYDKAIFLKVNQTDSFYLTHSKMMIP
jgi:thioredoxin 1